MAGDLGEFHAFREGRMCGNAVHAQKLPRAQAQRDGNFNVQRGLALQIACEDGVKRKLPTQHAHDQRCGQVAVGLRQRLHRGRTKQIVTVRVAGSLHAQEYAEGRHACS